MFYSSSCYGRLRLLTSLMATKPHGVHPIGGASISSAKKQRTMATGSATTDSAMKEEFAKHAEYLNGLNDKRERVVKASRDVTINSKKVIFQVHSVDVTIKEGCLVHATWKFPFEHPKIAHALPTLDCSIYQLLDFYPSSPSAMPPSLAPATASAQLSTSPPTVSSAQ